MPQLQDFTNACQEGRCPYIFIERCLMDVFWPYACGRLTFMCPSVFTYPQLPRDDSHERCPQADRTTTYHRRCEEESGLLRVCLQVNPSAKVGQTWRYPLMQPSPRAKAAIILMNLTQTTRYARNLSKDTRCWD